MPALLAGKETSPDGHARVVTTSSSGAYFHTLQWETFVDGPARRKKTPMDLYHQSKFVSFLTSMVIKTHRSNQLYPQGNVVVARQVAKRYADKGIISTSVNPGNLKTDLLRHASAIQKFFVVGNNLVLKLDGMAYNS